MTLELPHRNGHMRWQLIRRASWLPALCVLLMGTFVSSASPVHQAVRDNDIGLLKDLLVNGNPEDINAQIGRGVTPLHLAAATDNAEAATLLLAHGATLDARTEGGFTPLHWAASRDATATARVLIDAGADVNAETLRGITPIHWGASRGATNVLPLLIASGANLSTETDNGATPLHWAFMQEDGAAADLIASRMVEARMTQEATSAVVYAESVGIQAILARADEIEAAVKALPVSAPPVTPATNDVSEDTRPPLYVQTDKEAGSRALIVNIGLGETLVFEWVSTLRTWVGKYEVTNGQFRRFRPTHNSLFRESYSLDGNEQPVVHVSWEDANAFCEWLNRTYGDRLPYDFTFRLPTVREWTAIARCGERRRFPWGNTWPPRYGNFSDLTARENLIEWRGISPYDDGHVVTCPVSESGMNEWGIYGVAGNVWEWCEDWYSPSKQYKVRRGGSWDYDQKEDLRISAVGFDRPELRDDTIGFRVVASVKR